MECCNGYRVNPGIAEALRTKIVAENEFFFLSGYSERPDNMPDAVINSLYSGGINGRRTDNKVKVLCTRADCAGTTKRKSGRA